MGEEPATWKAFALRDLEAEDSYHELLRIPAMSAGVYRLAAGAIDRQRPHAEDELYYVVSGRGAFEVAGERRAIQPGTLLFVPARAPHRFVDIREALVLLVVFAPAEGGVTGA